MCISYYTDLWCSYFDRRGAGEMNHWLVALAFLLQDLSLARNIHIRWLTPPAIENLIPSGLRGHTNTCAHIFAQTHAHTYTHN